MSDYRPDDIFYETGGDDKSTVNTNESPKKTSGHIRIFGMSLFFFALVLYIGLSLWKPYFWGRLWILFLLVPVIDAIPLCIINKSVKYFRFSLTIVCIFLFLGLFFGLWRYAWPLFLTIPVWIVARKGESIRFFEYK